MSPSTATTRNLAGSSRHATSHLSCAPCLRPTVCSRLTHHNPHRLYVMASRPTPGTFSQHSLAGTAPIAATSPPSPGPSSCWGHSPAWAGVAHLASLPRPDTLPRDPDAHPSSCLHLRCRLHCFKNLMPPLPPSQPRLDRWSTLFPLAATSTTAHSFGAASFRVAAVHLICARVHAVLDPRSAVVRTFPSPTSPRSRPPVLPSTRPRVLPYRAVTLLDPPASRMHRSQTCQTPINSTDSSTQTKPAPPTLPMLTAPGCRI